MQSRIEMHPSNDFVQEVANKVSSACQMQMIQNVNKSEMNKKKKKQNQFKTCEND